MTRSRSGSFYCPLEPAWASLSITQKAALSTATCPNSKPQFTRRPVREVATVELPARAAVPSQPTPVPATFLSGGCGAEPVLPIDRPIPVVNQSLGHKDSNSNHSESPSRSFSPPTRMAMTYANATTQALQSGTLARPPLARRHAYSPRQPSPLRKQPNERARCPSALWTTHTDLLPFYFPASSPASENANPALSSHQRRRHHRSSSNPNPMLRHVLKNGFLSGPMAEKTRMYGLRVAWCVFGDVKDILAKDLFAGRRHRTSYSVDSPSFTSYTGRSTSNDSNSSTRLRRSPSSLILDLDPINLDEVDGDADAIVLEHDETVQLTIDEKVSKWEQEVQQRALENPLDGDSSSSSSSSTDDEDESDSKGSEHQSYLHLSEDGDSDSNSDSDSESLYDDYSDEELDSDSDTESAESLDDEAEVERDILSILEQTFLVGHKDMNVDIDIGSPPTPWELPFVGFGGGMCFEFEPILRGANGKFPSFRS